MNDLDLYIEGMERGATNLCLQIEKKHGLDGYPPEIVTVGLAALRDDEDMAAAIDAALGIDD